MATCMLKKRERERWGKEKETTVGAGMGIKEKKLNIQLVCDPREGSLTLPGLSGGW